MTPTAAFFLGFTIIPIFGACLYIEDAYITPWRTRRRDIGRMHQLRATHAEYMRILDGTMTDADRARILHVAETAIEEANAIQWRRSGVRPWQIGGGAS